MARFCFELATPADDEGLRAVLRETQMPGTISLQLLREPSFLQANCVLGDFHQTIVCRDTATGEIVGCGCRSVREMMVAGQPQPVGYLSMLRVKNKFRSIGLLARGYRYLGELHQDGRANFYLTTIAEGNHAAIELLTSGRLDLPSYEFAGVHTTFVLSCRSSNRAFDAFCAARDRCNRAPKDATDFHSLGESQSQDRAFVRTARLSDVDSIINFLESQALNRYYFPKYRPEDFLGPDAVFRNLNCENIWLAIDGAGDIVGTMGLWDQRPFRQTIIRSYQRSLNQLRPLYNVWANLTGGVRLPKPGQQLNCAFAAIPIVRDSSLFPELLRKVVEQARSMGLETILIGCHEQDEQWELMQSICQRSYSTRMYRVTWNEDRTTQEKMSDDSLTTSSNPYLELGCL